MQLHFGRRWTHAAAVYADCGTISGARSGPRYSRPRRPAFRADRGGQMICQGEMVRSAPHDPGCTLTNILWAPIPVAYALERRPA